MIFDMLPTPRNFPSLIHFFRVVRTSLPLDSPDGRGTLLITTSATLGMTESYNKERKTGSISSSKGPYRSRRIDFRLDGPVLQHLALHPVKLKLRGVSRSPSFRFSHHNNLCISLLSVHVTFRSSLIHLDVFPCTASWEEYI